MTERKAPTQIELKKLLNYYKNSLYKEAEDLALSISENYPDHPFSWKVLGSIYRQSNELLKSLDFSKRANLLDPKDFEIHNNLGNLFQDLGRFEEAAFSFKKVVDLNSNFQNAYYNLANVLRKLGKVEDAKLNYNFALEKTPNFGDIYWNLSSLASDINEAENCIDKCLNLYSNNQDEKFIRAKIMKSGLRYYQGDKMLFEELINSNLNNHAYLRSLKWIFSLPKLPNLHFNRWSFYNEIAYKSINSRPFYEFGVWTGASFKYLLKFFKKGFGFDTFTGLPEDWDTGIKIENIGSYSNYGFVPQIKGAEFIKGKFNETLPKFFSKKQPMASIINFDADLYSSTIFALSESKSVIDKHTILIFDEFIMNESWEKDEFKALNEFCFKNNYKYEVEAISFFSKQVAVKLLKI